MDSAANCSDTRDDAVLSDEVLDEVYGGMAKKTACACVEGHAACPDVVCC